MYFSRQRCAGDLGDMVKSLKCGWFIFPLSVLIIGSAFAKEVTLQERLDEEVQLQYGSQSFPQDLKTTLQGKHIIFVDGILNEIASVVGNYFTDNIEAVNKLGITYSHKAYPSGNSIPDNAAVLVEDIKAIYSRVQKPIILIGHSMGGAEAVYAVLKEPELLISNKVEKVISIEGAIGGSILAEHIIDNVMGRRLKQELGDGLESLKIEKARQNFKEVYEHYRNEVSRYVFGNASRTAELETELSDRVFYIRGAHRPCEKNLSFGLNIVYLFLEKNVMCDVENDGLMEVKNQILGIDPFFGVDLGVVDADHIQLVISGISSNRNAKYRRAFTRTMLKAAYYFPSRWVSYRSRSSGGLAEVDLW